ncbi:hypothetical protein BHE74_00020909, partial [Ensete ventricosum]
VEDGHTLHLVVRQPHQFTASPIGQMGYEGASGQSATNFSSDASRNHGSQSTRTLVFETVNIGQGDHRTQLSQVMLPVVAIYIAGQNLSGGASIDYPGIELGSGQVPNQFHSAVPLGSEQPTVSLLKVHCKFVIPDSLTTIHQYLGFMRDEFTREGLSANGTILHKLTRNEASAAHINNDSLQFHQSFSPGGLPSPASLVEVLLSTRQLLMEQADGYISANRGHHPVIAEVTPKSLAIFLSWRADWISGCSQFSLESKLWLEAVVIRKWLEVGPKSYAIHISSDIDRPRWVTNQSWFFNSTCKKDLPIIALLPAGKICVYMLTGTKLNDSHIQVAGENLNDASNSQSRRDPPEDPSPKRTRVCH